jgi:hypothetical protein
MLEHEGAKKLVDLEAAPLLKALKMASSSTLPSASTILATVK